MKEATGGALLMGLAAGIIIIFIIMVAFFISYGQAFRAKNSIINMIEQNEGATREEIINDIPSKYRTANVNQANDQTTCYNIIYKNGNVKGFTIEVTLYMQFDRTILGSVMNIQIPIRGETRIIESGNIYDVLRTTGSSAFQQMLKNMPKCS